MVRNHIAATNRVEEETLTTGSEHIVVRGEDDVARWSWWPARATPANKQARGLQEEPDVGRAVGCIHKYE